MSTKPQSRESQVVMVRSFGGEPRRLRAVGREGGYVTLRSDVTGSEIGFPRGLVYRFDPNLFEEISAAASADDRKRIDDLWQRAKPISGQIDDTR